MNIFNLECGIYYLEEICLKEEKITYGGKEKPLKYIKNLLNYQINPIKLNL